MEFKKEQELHKDFQDNNLPTVDSNEPNNARSKMKKIKRLSGIEVGGGCKRRCGLIGAWTRTTTSK